MALLKTNIDSFDSEDDDLGRTDTVKMKIYPEYYKEKDIS